MLLRVSFVFLLIFQPLVLASSSEVLAADIVFSDLPNLPIGAAGLLRVSDEEFLSFYFKGKTLRVSTDTIAQASYRRFEHILAICFDLAGSARTLHFRIKPTPVAADGDMLLAIIWRTALASPQSLSR